MTLAFGYRDDHRPGFVLCLLLALLFLAWAVA